jgi:hypothetical protein
MKTKSGVVRFHSCVCLATAERMVWLKRSGALGTDGHLPPLAALFFLKREQ